MTWNDTDPKHRSLSLLQKQKATYVYPIELYNDKWDDLWSRGHHRHKLRQQGQQIQIKRTIWTWVVTYLLMAIYAEEHVY